MSVFSVFNIGTNHVKTEVNNTIAALGNASTGPTVVNDGPNGISGQLFGWGMNDKLRDTVAAIKYAKPEIVNMTGHSRGAVLCHMLARVLPAGRCPLLGLEEVAPGSERRQGSSQRRRSGQGSRGRVRRCRSPDMLP